LIAIGDPRSDLPHAASEVTSIDKIWKKRNGSSEILLTESATKAALSRALSDATHLHLACHGEFHAAEPLEAALLLADGQRLTLREILDDPEFQLLPALRLVVLSACKTALINLEDWPEEVIGLPGGFLSAGVSRVIGTLWSVEDLSTSLFMLRFYHNLLIEKQQPAVALREAQLWLRQGTRQQISEFCSCFPEMNRRMGFRDARPGWERAESDGDIPFANPYYWAGFVLLGA
jgi:CHAT domain-containing protein